MPTPVARESKNKVSPGCTTYNVQPGGTSPQVAAAGVRVGATVEVGVGLGGRRVAVGWTTAGTVATAGGVGVGTAVGGGVGVGAVVATRTATGVGAADCQSCQLSAWASTTAANTVPITPAVRSKLVSQS